MPETQESKEVQSISEESLDKVIIRLLENGQLLAMWDSYVKKSEKDIEDQERKRETINNMQANFTQIIKDQGQAEKKQIDSITANCIKELRALLSNEEILQLHLCEMGAHLNILCHTQSKRIPILREDKVKHSINALTEIIQLYVEHKIQEEVNKSNGAINKQALAMEYGKEAINIAIGKEPGFLAKFESKFKNFNQVRKQLLRNVKKNAKEITKHDKSTRLKGASTSIGATLKSVMSNTINKIPRLPLRKKGNNKEQLQTQTHGEMSR